MDVYGRCILVTRYKYQLITVALFLCWFLYWKRWNQLTVPWSPLRPQTSESTAGSRNLQTHLSVAEHDVMEYSNPTINVQFKLRLTLSPVDQCTVINLTRYLNDSKLFVPRRKVVWMDEEKNSMAWRNIDILGMKNNSFSPMFKSPCWFVNSTLRCLPYFYLVGAPKCGTTDLFKRMTRHPDVINPKKKEPHWLTRKRFNGLRSKTTAKTVSDYLNYFSKLSLRLSKDNLNVNTSSTKITGDFSASTLWDNLAWPDLPRNDNPLEPTYTNADYIHKLNPDTRIIMLLRDPVTRLYSDYLYFTPGHRGQPALFHRYVVDAIRIFSRCMQMFSLRSCVYSNELIMRMKVRLNIGIYFIYLMEWYRRFPRNQILILKSEEYTHNTGKVLMGVFEFLGLKKMDENNMSSIVDKKKANTRTASDIEVGEMWPETKQLLNAFHLPFNRRLDLLLGDVKMTQ